MPITKQPNLSQDNTDKVLAAVALVKNKYPKAEVNRDGAMFFCHDGINDLGAGFSKDAAWQSAACNCHK